VTIFGREVLAGELGAEQMDGGRLRVTFWRSEYEYWVWGVVIRDNSDSKSRCWETGKWRGNTPCTECSEHVLLLWCLAFCTEGAVRAASCVCIQHSAV